MDKISLQHEGKLFHIVGRRFEEYHGITAAIITMNEEENIVSIINHLRPIVKRIVVVDGGSSDKTVKLAEPLVDALCTIPFKGHYANQKNRAIEMCTTDWVLSMDPDERLSDEVYHKMIDLTDQDDIDCYAFPRREFRGGKEYPEVYPDYQRRLFRSYCRYIRPVHEELVGYKSEKFLPQKSGFDFIHTKPEERHELRNDSYVYFEANFSYEMGSPGHQTKDTCVAYDIDKIKDLLGGKNGEGK